MPWVAQNIRSVLSAHHVGRESVTVTSESLVCARGREGPCCRRVAMATAWVPSARVSSHAQKLGVEMVSETPQTSAGAQALWRKCVSWGVNPMPCRILAVKRGEVVGASYYETGRGFLSALAVDPGHRNKGLGRLLIAATVEDMAAKGVRSPNLHVLGSDMAKSNGKLKTLYESCGFKDQGGGNFSMDRCPADLDAWMTRILQSA